MNHIIDNTFQAPHYIFIRCESTQTQDILNRLKLNSWSIIHNLELKQSIGLGKRHFFTTWQNGWFHIIDDWYYTLWFDQELRRLLLKLSEDYKIFTCSIGDIDHSYEFRLLIHGELIREYEVKALGEGKRSYIIDRGSPLAPETKALKQLKIEDKVLSIAKGIGISINHSFDNIRTYIREELEHEKFKFNEDEY